jgi:hypothetical protein
LGYSAFISVTISNKRTSSLDKVKQRNERFNNFRSIKNFVTTIQHNQAKQLQGCGVSPIVFVCMIIVLLGLECMSEEEQKRLTPVGMPVPNSSSLALCV